MRGCIVKRGKSPNHWALIIEHDKDPITGKRRQQWMTFIGKRPDAEKKLTELLRQKDTGVYVEPGKYKLSDFLNKWLRDYAKPKLSPKAYERYESIVRVHIVPTIGSIKLTSLRSGKVQEFYNALFTSGLAPRSVRYAHVVLHKALVTAQKWGLLVINPA
jgi:integrase